MEGSFLDEYLHLVWTYFHEGVLVYFAILGTDIAFDYYQRFRDREVQAARLKEQLAQAQLDRKSTRLNSSHSQISYAVFCLKKKKKKQKNNNTTTTHNA